MDVASTASNTTDQLRNAAQQALDQYAEINRINEDRDRALNLEKSFTSTEQKINEFIGSSGDAINNFKA